jgi:hypothetical protein
MGVERRLGGTLLLAAVVALAGACGGSSEDANAPADTTASAAPTAPPPDDPVARWAARLPDSLRHRSGACPFECCVYREWTGTGEIGVREGPRRSLPIAFRIPAGEAFTADSGFVQITGVSVLAVEDSVRTDATRFVPGDTLIVLDYVGEGLFNVWDGEQVWQVGGFWGAEADDPKASLLGGGEYAREWWAHATTSAGRKGWIDMDSIARIRGADACGQ